MARMIDRIIDGTRRSIADSRARPARAAVASALPAERDVVARPGVHDFDAMVDARDDVAVSPGLALPTSAVLAAPASATLTASASAALTLPTALTAGASRASAASSTLTGLAAPPAPGFPASATPTSTAPTAPPWPVAMTMQRLASWLSEPDATSAEDPDRGSAPSVTRPTAMSERSPVVARPRTIAAPLPNGPSSAPAADDRRDPALADRSVTWTAQPVTVPTASTAALRNPTPLAEAVAAALAGARIDSRPAAIDRRDAGDGAPRELDASTVERIAPAGPDRSAHPMPAPAIVEVAPVRFAPISAPQPQVLSQPTPSPANELIIDHVDIRVITEPPPPVPERRAPSALAVTRSGAWNPAARHYIGRWS